MWRNVAVIGAAGKMGKWLCRFLLNEGFNVFANDLRIDELTKLKNSIPNINICSLEKCVTNSETVIISVPIDSFKSVIRELKPYVRDDQLVIDVCSVKKFPVTVMHSELKKGIKLGTHPLFGPGTKSINKKKVVLTPINEEEVNLASEIIKWLGERGCYGILLDPSEHDSLMTVMMGIPHAVGLILSKYLSGLDLNTLEFLNTPTYNFMMRYSTAILGGNLDLYISIQRHLEVSNELKKLSNMINDFASEVANEPEKALQEFLNIRRKVVNNGLSVSKSYELMYKLFEELQ